ncbi:3,4-dihydroxy-2-butanone-4-phosphate synthase [Curtobacterium aetherium]|uniref:3,4-dihydroxy-2-butanone-4-phosphate synthase n=1 Tax=Curtobacterium aetherium TaxID=2841594 RepID=UPI003B51EA50
MTADTTHPAGPDQAERTTSAGAGGLPGERVTEGLSTVDEAVAAIAAGRPVIVADDEHRENEGDVVLAAELASPEWIAWTVAHSSGFICAPVSAAIADALDLPPMVQHNEDVRGTAYTVTVDAAVGVTTGISAHDRARTLRVLADPASVRDDLHRPGHVVPLRARAGGVRERAGHTEAAIDLVTAAGLRPAAAICEIVDERGDMMRLPQLVGLGAREGVPVITIAALATWLDAADRAADDAVRTEGTHA